MLASTILSSVKCRHSKVTCGGPVLIDGAHVTISPFLTRWPIKQVEILILKTNIFSLHIIITNKSVEAREILMFGFHLIKVSVACAVHSNGMKAQDVRSYMPLRGSSISDSKGTQCLQSPT
jgi:hypothetical protein